MKTRFKSHAVLPGRFVTWKKKVLKIYSGKSSIKIKCLHLIQFAKNRKGFVASFEPFAIGYYWIFLWIAYHSIILSLIS